MADRRQRGVGAGSAALVTLAATLMFTLAAADAAFGAKFSIEDAQMLEGTGETSKLKLKVTRTGAAQAASVRYRTLDATAVAPGDFASKKGKLTFKSGRDSRRIKVLVVGDSVFEPDESFEVELIRPRHAGLRDALGEGTIENDDGCFASATAAAEGTNAGDLSSGACPPGAGGDAVASCQTDEGRHSWWSFTIPAGETATLTVPATGIRDFGMAIFTANSSGSELDCKDGMGPGGDEAATVANPNGAPLTVYVQVFAVAGHEGAYTLEVESTGDCFSDAAAATEGVNAGDLAVNSCVPSAGGDAVASCQTGAGRHAWWSFTIPAGETATFTVPATGTRDLGLALYSANSSAAELDCQDIMGPAGNETTFVTNSGGAPLTVYAQVFAAVTGHEGAYSLNVQSAP